MDACRWQGYEEQSLQIFHGHGNGDGDGDGAQLPCCPAAPGPRPAAAHVLPPSPQLQSVLPLSPSRAASRNLLLAVLGTGQPRSLPTYYPPTYLPTYLCAPSPPSPYTRTHAHTHTHTQTHTLVRVAVPVQRTTATGQAQPFAQQCILRRPRPRAHSPEGTTPACGQDGKQRHPAQGYDQRPPTAHPFLG